MKLIYEPTVYVLSIQNLLTPSTDFLPGLDKFFHDHDIKWRPEAMGEIEMDGEVADSIPEVAGRVCYMSFDNPRPGGNAAYIKHIKEVGHGSVLEHTAIGLIMTGVSRSLSHELVRHRAGWAFSQLSQRYVDETVAEYVVPPGLRREVELAEGFDLFLKGYREYDDAPERQIFGAYTAKFHPTENPPALWDLMTVGRKWIARVQSSHDGYVEQVEYMMNKLKKEHNEINQKACRNIITFTPEQRTAMRKEARQTARSLLPNATETKVVGTANARALRHFIEQRCHPAADAEIRILAGEVWEVCVKVAPNLFSDYTKKELPDGTFSLDTPYRKV